MMHPRTKLAPGLALVTATLAGVGTAAMHVELRPNSARGGGLRGPESETEPPWSFSPVERCELPEVDDDGWSRVPWDRLVWARMAEVGLEPAVEADPGTLLRRLHLDLTGLPPTAEEVEAFVMDTSAGAWERRVDELLASPHFGERMALPWLDLARYADTNGYDADDDREMWAWRDWVVRAFNDNLSFADFTLHQIAGDMLEDATLDQRIATGFHRNHPVTDQILGQDGEYRHQYVADRVATASTAWLGLTMGCAECHDHVADPVSIEEYYGFYALLGNVDETGLMGGGNAEPLLRLPDAEQGARLLEMQTEIDRLRRVVDQLEGEPEGAVRAWLAGLEKELGLAEGAESTPLSELAPLRTIELDEELPGVEELRGLGEVEWVPGVFGKALELDGTDGYLDCGDARELALDLPFSVSLWAWLEPEAPEGTFLARSIETEIRPGFEIWESGGRIGASMQGDLNEEDGWVKMAADPVAWRRWHHVAVTYDGSRSRSGFELRINGELVVLRPALEARSETIEGKFPEGLGLRVGSSDLFPLTGRVDRVRIYDRVLTPRQVREEFRRDLVAATKVREGRDVKWSMGLRARYAAVGSESLGPKVRRLRKVEREHGALLGEVPVVSILEEREERRETRVLLRGQFDDPGDVVEPGLPASFPRFGEAPVGNRLDLARWMVHPENPLVPRVAVNRIWQQIVGRGLVGTPADFGKLGDAPSHPELLDWLARDYVDGGYDTKAFVKSIVLSATYRQSSAFDAERVDLDPENRWLSRANRMRLPAELIYDGALAMSGLLDPSLGGPPVEGGESGAAEGEESGDDGVTVAKEDAPGLRRGLYVYRKRHEPYGPFDLFDAPTRDTCVAMRGITTTPLQVLALWNDPVRIRAAEALGNRLLDLDGVDDRGRLDWGLTTCTGRGADSEALRVLAELLDGGRAEFMDASPEERERRAWRGVASVLLSLDATITRE